MTDKRLEAWSAYCMAVMLLVNSKLGRLPDLNEATIGEMSKDMKKLYDANVPSGEVAEVVLVKYYGFKTH